MRAAVLVREQPHYRRDAFCSGLEAVGYTVGRPVATPARGDLLLIWNRYGEGARLAAQYEAAGATVVVAENGFLGREWCGRAWYSLALGWNAGVGHWPVGGFERALRLFPWVGPWRTGAPADFEYVLVLAQRGIGSPPVAQPANWHLQAAAALEALGHRVRMRGHPGAHQDNDGLHADLYKATCAVTWASGAGIKALLRGIPVYHGLAGWVGAQAARHWLPGRPLPAPYLGPRDEMLRRLAWGMWSVEEIAAGHAFDHLLRGPSQAL